MEIHNGEMT
jgi:hypothetical protein